jgi:hypothetical protein
MNLLDGCVHLMATTFQVILQLHKGSKTKTNCSLEAGGDLIKTGNMDHIPP